jgi:hypothetical protein
MRYRIKPDLAESKLILLFLASRMPAGLDHDDFVRFNMEGDWMLYFELEQYLPELEQDGLLALREDDGRRLYAATAEGLNVLSLLKARIPLSIRTFIDERMTERRAELEQEQEIAAGYSQDSAREYPVTLKVLENGRPLLEMNLTAPSAEGAELVCRHFREQAADIYAGIIERLTQDDGKEES